MAGVSVLGKPARKPVSTTIVIMKPGYVYRKRKSRSAIPFPVRYQEESEVDEHHFHSRFDSIQQLPVKAFFNVSIFKLNDIRKIWSSSSFNIDDFDLIDGGVYIATAGEAVICDREFCLCSSVCDCNIIRYVETFLYCDGTYTQRLVHADSDDTEALRKMGRHNLRFKACGSKSCSFCGGVDAESLY